MLNTKNLMQENPRLEWESETEYVNRIRLMARQLKLTHVRESLFIIKQYSLSSLNNRIKCALEDLTDLVEDLI